MEILFRNFSEDATIEYQLLSSLEDNGDLLIQINSKKYYEDDVNSLFFRLNKKELRDYIGALLHLQSQLNKK